MLAIRLIAFVYAAILVWGDAWYFYRLGPSTIALDASTCMILVLSASASVATLERRWIRGTMIAFVAIVGLAAIGSGLGEYSWYTHRVDKIAVVLMALLQATVYSLVIFRLLRDRPHWG